MNPSSLSIRLIFEMLLKHTHHVHQTLPGPCSYILHLPGSTASLCSLQNTTRTAFHLDSAPSVAQSVCGLGTCTVYERNLYPIAVTNKSNDNQHYCRKEKALETRYRRKRQKGRTLF